MMHAYAKAASWLTIGPMLLACAQAAADAFGPVRYDRRSQLLIVEVHYDGTNPNHAFHVQWSSCKRGADGVSGYEVNGDILDEQWSDHAVKSFTKIVRISVADLKCRPVRITLHMAPRFFSTIDLP